ncbi:sensor histidine kinase [Dyella nitratireducens]|uniref:Histidine kinase n=1 Tax=Dyella nitratireducens TaxID=1849580 RepID=A0ABQ1GE32_9GAMM|nr:sensor histidine kinase [Dyella nitratireducens]GGA42031.1 histidine kinase [Dyella nitratireducens]GLQ42060.1 histidine kinase [Dyella nitratireducens]
MNHRTWMVVNGAPADNWDIKQDGKGFIWLATSTGLFRFDGVQFQRYVPAAGQSFLSTDMTALRIVSDDDFWVGTSDGVISHIKAGHVVSYPISNTAKEGPVYAFAVTPDGAMWVVAGRALLRYSDGKLAKVGVDWDFPPDMQAMWMLVDKEGTAWLATDRELLFLRKGSHRFEHTGISTGLYSVLALSPDGTLWVSDGVHGTRALPGLSAGHVPSQLLKPLPATHFAQSMRLVFDKSGALWGTLSYRSGMQGIFRVANPSQFADGQPLRPEQVTDRYSTEQGFTSIVTVPMLVDREGDVWVGTDFGLNRFHTNSFKAVSPLPGASPVETWLSPDDAGNVLLLQEGCLYQVSHAVASELTCAFPASSYHIIKAGNRFISETAEGFYQWSPQAGSSPLKLPGNQASWDTTAVGKDAHGNLWLGFSGSLYELEGDAWRKAEIENPLGHKQPTAIAFDAGNTMWLGYPNGQILRWNGHAATVYTASEGLSIGNVEAIAAQSGSILVGGDTGVARWKNGRFQSLSMARLPVLSAVSGVAETKTGDLWLNTSVGVVRIEASEAERAFDDAGYTPSYRLYGGDDGVPGIAFRQPLASTITTDEHGRLWFLTNQGVCWIDPSTVHANPVAPQTVIESIVAEGRPFPIDSHLALPPHTATISFQYTAASLRAPQNVKFRYKLSGVDTHWQDGGAQRQAVYANLKPGDYAFQVEAANSDGVWSEHPSILAFQIERTFYQTRIFRILSIMAAILCVVALALMERRRMLRALRDRLEVRHAERERIARELHDTLLQGVQGLTLCMQAFADHIPKGDPFRAKVDQSLERAYELLVDGRDRVRDLRTRDHAAKDLAEAFTSLAEDFAEEWPARFQIACTGIQQGIIPVIREEIYLIGREALLNAFQHAMATQVDVAIAYDVKQLRVCIRDDGVGIDPQILDAGHRPGHWGLVGMRERAGAIGGRLLIRASAGAGTEIELVVPAGIAYAHPRQSRWMWFKQRLPSSWRVFPDAVQPSPKYPMP